MRPEDTSRRRFHLRLALASYVVLICAGAALRIWQFAADTSLYIDEIAVARDVMNHPVLSLVTHSLPDQVAPRGFLLAEKTAVWGFGQGDSVLRLFPLLTSAGALLLFWRVARRLEGAGGPVAMALFAGAIPLVSFSAQVKQYSSDVFFGLLLVGLALQFFTEPALSRRRIWAAGFAGAVIPWFSQPGVIVALSLSALLFCRFAKEYRDHIDVFLAGGIWSLSSVAAAADAFWSVDPGIRGYVHRVWAGGFLPMPIGTALATRWPWGPIKGVLGAGASASLDYPLPGLYLSLILLGFWSLWRWRRILALTLIAPIAAALGAAIAQTYPFADRLILFLFPMFLLALGAGIDQIRRWTALAFGSSGLRVMGWVLYGVLGLAPLWSTVVMPPVYHVEDMKAVLRYLESERQPGDRIYTYYAAAPATVFYGSRYGLHEEDYAVGGCHRGEGRRYLEELDRFRGSRRVWILLTHALPEFREREDILRYLDTIGTRRRSFVAPARTPDNRNFPGEAYLYDLSDPARLGRAAAASFPIVGPHSAEAHRACLYGPQVMIAPRGI